MSRIAAEMMKVTPSRFSSQRHRFEQLKQRLTEQSNASVRGREVFLNLLEEMNKFEQSRLKVARPLNRNEGTNSGNEGQPDVVPGPDVTGRKADVSDASERKPAEETKAEITTKTAKKAKRVAFQSTLDDTRLCAAVKTEQATAPKTATTKAEPVTATETSTATETATKSENTTTETSTNKTDETTNTTNTDGTNEINTADKKADSERKERANVVATLPGTIRATPPDGHCLLHAVRLCLDHLDLSVRYDELKLKLAREAMEYKPLYEPFYIGENFYKEFKDYVFDKKYNTEMGDLILPILLNALGLTAVVYEKTDDGKFTWTRLEPSREGVRGAHSIHLLRSSQELKIRGGRKGAEFVFPIEFAHYEALIPGFRPNAEKESERDR